LRKLTSSHQPSNSELCPFLPFRTVRKYHLSRSIIHLDIEIEHAWVFTLFPTPISFFADGNQLAGNNFRPAQQSLSCSNAGRPSGASDLTSGFLRYCHRMICNDSEVASMTLVPLIESRVGSFFEGILPRLVR